MNFALSEDHVALRQSAASFLDKEIALDALLKPGASVADVPYAVNSAKIAELGWSGIVVPETYGGWALLASTWRWCWAKWAVRWRPAASWAI